MSLYRTGRISLGARPLPLPVELIANFVQWELVPEVVKTLTRLQPIYADAPLNDALKTRPLSIGLRNVAGEGVVAFVEVRSKPSPAKYATVLAGKYNQGANTVTLYVNGALSVNDILVPSRYEDRMQPLGTCAHVSCLPHGLYRTLLHELTHAADILKPHQYDTTAVWEGKSERDFQDYVNDPNEVTAMVRDILEDTMHLAEAIAPAASSRTDLMEKVLSLSDTWTVIGKSLKPKNRERIFKAVYDGLARKGLV